MKRSILCAATAGALAAGVAFADVTVYNRANFTGPSLTIKGEARNLEGTGFYDTISSIEVHSGRWQFCSRPNFNGDCEVLGPGRYATLDKKLNHRIESVRQVERVAKHDPAPGWHEDRPDWNAPRRGPRHGAIELYSAPGFRGPSTAYNRDAWSLERRDMDDRVSSLVVNEGVWELCTDRGFEGFCRTFGPGEYPQLGRRMNDNVNSLRRVG